MDATTRRKLLQSALAGLVALAAAAPAAAEDKGSKDQEKCYGVAKAGHNDCANLTGSHSCAGQAQMNDAAEWNYVAKGTCKDMGGLTMEEAKMKLASDKKMEPMKK